jgi:hypothetical protein
MWRIAKAHFGFAAAHARMWGTSFAVTIIETWVAVMADVTRVTSTSISLSKPVARELSRQTFSHACAHVSHAHADGMLQFESVSLFVFYVFMRVF